MQRDFAAPLLFALTNLRLKATSKHLNESWGNNGMMIEEFNVIKRSVIFV